VEVINVTCVVVVGETYVLDFTVVVSPCLSVVVAVLSDTLPECVTVELEVMTVVEIFSDELLFLLLC